MTKYPLWKYIVIIIAIVIGVIYTAPNFYGEAPAVQVSAVGSSVQIDSGTLDNINNLLKQNTIVPTGEIFDGHTLKLQFVDTDVQIKARDLIAQNLGGSYSVALNLMSQSPSWFAHINAYPMFLGLDLRGGVHFLLEVDMNAAIKKTLDKYSSDIKHFLRKNYIRYSAINISGNTVNVTFADSDQQTKAYNILSQDLTDIQFTNSPQAGTISASISPEQIKQIQASAIKQNILILHNRVNELGVAEPIIQQQGSDRIVVELPGLQDTARAKNILGRTATLEVHLVDDDPSDVNAGLAGNVPPNTELLDDVLANGQTQKILINKEVELTGDNITDAQPGFDENGSPAVNIRLDSVGAAIFKQITGDNVGKRLAMVLVDNGKAQVVTAPVIRTQIGGGQVQISGAMTVEQANDVALLLRSGSLAAPMNIIEERTIGPSLGRANIDKGFHSVVWGFAAITIFMAIYYMVFGVVAVISLATNLLLLIAVLSMLQATLTLPGIAAIALTLGMAIDSNVLINERIREELRNGAKPHLAIESGYKHAFNTILDSNVTTLIAGLALLAFGSGPVKGFAVVHCLGILTSLFSAVLVSRGIVGLLYAKTRIKKLYI